MTFPVLYCFYWFLVQLQLISSFQVLSFPVPLFPVPHFPVPLFPVALLVSSSTKTHFIVSSPVVSSPAVSSPAFSSLAVTSPVISSHVVFIARPSLQCNLARCGRWIALIKSRKVLKVIELNKKNKTSVQLILDKRHCKHV